MKPMPILTEDPRSISFQCIRVKQPIGDFYIASIPYRQLCDITFFDVRRILKEERDVETYLGIQRPLSPRRVAELKQYVRTVDATFPTAVIVAVDADCAQYDGESNTMKLSNHVTDLAEGEEPIFFRQIAKVLDGQHRLEGLNQGEPGIDFDINVSIFVAIDIAEQANIFSTVNLAQTKVNKSLAYDLFDLAKARSPQKTCHNIAVALDQNIGSPFYQRIKRLGVATEGRFNETITQATFVESLLPYLSTNPPQDRDLYLRRKKPVRATPGELYVNIFRNMFLDEKDLEIADVIWNYFNAVKHRWPSAWDAADLMLNRTNGFKAFMRFLRPAYLKVSKPGSVSSMDSFVSVLNRVPLQEADFNTNNFKPGNSGASALFRVLEKVLG